MRIRSQRGAILIIVSAALLALTLFSAVVVDYGLMWVSRNQAQNTADAAAIAGAWARVLYDQSSPPASKT